MRDEALNICILVVLHLPFVLYCFPVQCVLFVSCSALHIVISAFVANDVLLHVCSSLCAAAERLGSIKRLPVATDSPSGQELQPVAPCAHAAVESPVSSPVGAPAVAAAVTPPPGLRRADSVAHRTPLPPSPPSSPAMTPEPQAATSVAADAAAGDPDVGVLPARPPPTLRQRAVAGAHRMASLAGLPQILYLFSGLFFGFLHALCTSSCAAPRPGGTDDADLHDLGLAPMPTVDADAPPQSWFCVVLAHLPLMFVVPAVVRLLTEQPFSGVRTPTTVVAGVHFALCTVKFMRVVLTDGTFWLAGLATAALVT